MEILGAIVRDGTELVVLGSCHFILRKSDMPSQVSSTLSMTLLSCQSLMKASAHCYRST